MLKKKNISPERREWLEKVVVLLLTLTFFVFVLLYVQQSNMDYLIVLAVSYVGVVSFGVAMLLRRDYLQGRQRLLWVLSFLLFPPFSLVYFSFSEK